MTRSLACRTMGSCSSGKCCKNASFKIFVKVYSGRGRRVDTDGLKTEMCLIWCHGKYFPVHNVKSVADPSPIFRSIIIEISCTRILMSTCHVRKGLVSRACQSLLLVWHRLLFNIICEGCYSQCHIKRRIVRHTSLPVFLFQQCGRKLCHLTCVTRK